MNNNHKVTKNKQIHNLIILDESGSMESIKPQILAGFNETIQVIKEDEKAHPELKHLLTFISFNSATGNKMSLDAAPISRAREITDEIYHPSSLTPLYDAMGYGITHVRDTDKTSDNVLVTILTDGYENASREYRLPDIKALVDEMKSRGWTFTYMGADHDVEQVALTLSIEHYHSFGKSVFEANNMLKLERDARLRHYNAVREDNPLSQRYFDLDMEDN